MKFMTDILKIVRLPERVKLPDGSIQEAKNIGVDPAGQLRPMMPGKKSRLDRTPPKNRP